MNMKVFLLTFINLMQLLLQAKGNINLNLNSEEDVCRYFPNNATIRKPGSCTETLKCIDGKSQFNSKCDEGKMISLKDMKCTKSVTDSYCSGTSLNCTENGPKFIEDNKNCHEWHTCNGKKLVNSGTCSPNGIFSPDKQACIAGNFNCNKTYNICDIAEEGKPIWDENNCHKYFTCSKSKLTHKQCDDTKHYYDIRSDKCIAKAKVDCYKHPIPDEVCGNQKLAIRNRYVKDQATCRGYFFCKYKNTTDLGYLDWNYDPDLNPRWDQCPMGLFFDEDLQACRDQNYVKCEEDRCDSRKSGKILSEERGCHSFLICQNGHTEGNGTCENGKYFDPLTEECVYNKISYPICA